MQNEKSNPAGRHSGFGQASHKLVLAIIMIGATLLTAIGGADQANSSEFSCQISLWEMKQIMLFHGLLKAAI